MTIREAITKVAFSMSDEWEFYLSVIDTNESIKERNELEEAIKILAKNNINNKAVSKHIARQSNIVSEPIRFIDRAFRAIETDELPF